MAEVKTALISVYAKEGIDVFAKKDRKSVV